MLKCSSDRCVCAPQSLSAGTSTSPRLSVSLRAFVIARLLVFLETPDVATSPAAAHARHEPSMRIAGSRGLSDVGVGLGTNPVPYCRVASRQSQDALLELAIGERETFVLSKMLGP